jgi:pimeloyl-ACP methyl ester carboxylesterase
VLIANSMGCQIAAHYASVNPLQVRAVVLSCPFGLEGQASGRARLGRNEALLRLLAPWISRARLRRELAKAAVDASLISPRILDSYWASLRTAAGRRVASQQLARIAFRVPLEPMLPGIRQPLLILLGELDPLCWPEHAGQLKSLSPGAQVLRLHGLGHLPFLQDPQEMHRQISFFLSSRTLGASEARGALPLLPHPNNYP